MMEVYKTASSVTTELRLMVHKQSISCYPQLQPMLSPARSLYAYIVYYLVGYSNLSILVKY